MSENVQKTIELPTTITVRDLAKSVEASPIQVIKILMANGVMANINQQVDFDTAAVVATELGFEASPETLDISEDTKTSEIPEWRQLIADEDPKKLANRPPVVTILGHVDHGKTTILDTIRHTNIVEGEVGGITQHIGAYQITHNGQEITFLDTPGHAAFTAMRARGAQGADIVILVVAVNDGVMPQTREAIAHARAAQVPIIVALNKIDLPDANIDFVKKQLAEIGFIPDDWEGNTIMVPVSAKQKTGIEDLLEAILLVADNNDIYANPNGKVIGTVIEAQIDKSRGIIATLLVQNGTLKIGNNIIVGTAYGRVRAMYDFHGNRTNEAGPSTPVQVLGLSEVPHAGDLFYLCESEKEARLIAKERKQKEQQKKANVPKATLEELFERIQAGDVQELNLIIKVDVQGSLEPITNSLNELSQDNISIRILHAEAGIISENDIMLAAASRAIVIGFNVQSDMAARTLAETEGVSIRQYDIIYHLTDDIDKALKGMLEPQYREILLGSAEVLAIFQISKVGKVAGCKVTEGVIRRNARIRVLRGEEKIFDGELGSLKHEKDDVLEMRQGFECGMAFKNFNDIEEGDIIESYNLELFGI